MGLGVSLPWMLCWLAAAVVPLVLARRALRRPRLVRWAATDLLAAAARSSHITRGGLPWLLLLARGVVLAAAAAAATRPFIVRPTTAAPLRPGATASDAVPTERRSQQPTAGPTGPRLAAAGDESRIVSRIVLITRRTPDATGFDARAAAAAAIAAAVESLATASPRAGAGPRTEVVRADLAALARLPAAPRTLLVLGDEPPPAPHDARLLADAVAAGDSLLVCLGPRSVGDEDARRQTSAWLEGMIGITVEGHASVADADIEVADGLAVDPAIDGTADGFTTLPGPGVQTAAVLRGRPASVLARAAPAGLPLVVEARHGRGVVCVSALPLSLPPAGRSIGGDAVGQTVSRDDDWSDIAAWPIFVPFVDRLAARLLDAAAARAPADADRRRAPLPLARPLIVVAIVAVFVDWWLSRRMVGTATLSMLCRSAALMTLATMAAAWARPPAVALHAAPSRRPVAVVIDTSPSMGTAGSAPAASTRLAAVLAALREPATGAAPLDRIARDRPVHVFTAATRLTDIGPYPHAATAAALPTLTAAPAAAGASRIGDAVESLVSAADGVRDDGVDGADDLVPAAIVIASDGAITAGASWAAAARAAAARGVPLVAIPAASDGEAATGPLPPGFCITRVDAPRLCHAAEPFAIDVRAEATADAGPLDVVLATAGSGAVLARGRLLPEPAADGMVTRFAGRLVVPAGFGAPGSRLESPVVLVGRHEDVAAADATPLTTCPLAVTDAPTRVLLIESAPRFEHRFLARLLARDPAFAVETCLLSPPPLGGVATTPLPRSSTAWNAYDVVVLGDVSDDPAADRADAWLGLRQAAAEDGIGIAWIPGGRWWNDPDPGLAWLPAVPGDMPPASAPRRLEPVSAGRGDAWLPSAAGQGTAAGFRPEVFQVLRAAALRPTARTIASCRPADALPESVPDPAIVIDRLGAATILVHLCDTWRWQRDDPQAWATHWRTNVLRLAVPHQLDRLFSATLRPRPAAWTAGQPMRLDIATGSGVGSLAGWRLEVQAAASPLLPAASGVDRSATTRSVAIPTAGLGAVTTVVLDGLAAGLHTARLVPPVGGPPTAAAAIDLFVADPPVEAADGGAAVGPLMAAARASGGAVVRLDAIDSLPETLTTITSRQPATAQPAEIPADPPGWLSSRGAAHVLLAALVAVTTAAWWQPRGGAT